MSWFAYCRRTTLRLPNPARRQFSFSFRPRFPRDPSHLRNAPSPLQATGVPSFREQIVRAIPVQSFADVVRHPAIGKHILFVVGTSALVYAVAAYNTNLDTMFWTAYLSTQKRWNDVPPTARNIQLVQTEILYKKCQAQFKALNESLEGVPSIAKTMIANGYAMLAEMYINASEGRRVGYAIVAVNVGIWIAWQIPILRPFMRSHFIHHPLSGKSYTMLTSMFSHSSFIHLLCNSMALTSFASSTSIWMTLGQGNAPSQLRESTAVYHFLALYLSAGLFSSLVSHVVNARLVYPRLVSKLARPGETGSPGIIHRLFSNLSSVSKSNARPDAAAATSTIRGSLGASGAIYSTVIVSALAFPQAEVSLIFPPTPSFPIQYGVGGVVLLDCIGILRGWRLFDHFAHLGGATLGAMYYMYGIRAWDAMRLHALKWTTA
ncbi:hypothetical protein BGW80DRAFT_304415 [Lactifluus volemus]|nr:hypothetical protein BGW80DRAFT_304415 [Lactifluus volemus]